MKREAVSEFIVIMQKKVDSRWIRETDSEFIVIMQKKVDSRWIRETDSEFKENSRNT